MTARLPRAPENTEQTARAQAVAALGKLLKAKTAELGSVAQVMDRLADGSVPIGRIFQSRNRGKYPEIGAILSKLEQYLATPCEARQLARRKYEVEAKRRRERQREAARADRKRRRVEYERSARDLDQSLGLLSPTIGAADNVIYLPRTEPGDDRPPAA